MTRDSRSRRFGLGPRGRGDACVAPTGDTGIAPGLADRCGRERPCDRDCPCRQAAGDCGRSRRGARRSVRWPCSSIRWRPMLRRLPRRCRGQTPFSRRRPTARSDGRTIEVPVVYGGDAGPDLAHVAAFAGCSPETVIERHASRAYRVFMLGFLPGFAYMASVDETIAAPRRADATRAGARRIGRDRRTADGHLSARLARRVADHRTNGVDAVRSRPHSSRALRGRRPGAVRSDLTGTCGADPCGPRGGP